MKQNNLFMMKFFLEFIILHRYEMNYTRAFFFSWGLFSCNRLNLTFFFHLIESSHLKGFYPSYNWKIRILRIWVFFIMREIFFFFVFVSACFFYIHKVSIKNKKLFIILYLFVLMYNLCFTGEKIKVQNYDLFFTSIHPHCFVSWIIKRIKIICIKKNFKINVAFFELFIIHHYRVNFENSFNISNIFFFHPIEIYI